MPSSKQTTGGCGCCWSGGTRPTHTELIQGRTPDELNGTGQIDILPDGVRAVVYFPLHRDDGVLDVDLGGDPLGLARTVRWREVPFLFFTGYQSALPPEFLRVGRLKEPADAARVVRAVGSCCQVTPRLP